MTPFVMRSGQGAPILYLHCALAHSGVWAPLARLVGGASLWFDLPGHGQSPDWWESADYQADCVRWAADLLTGPAHVVGHSFGGTVALRLAAEHPELVSDLTLIEPVYFAALEAADPAAFDRYLREFEPILQAAEAADWDRAAQIFNDLWALQPWCQTPELQREVARARMPLVIAQGVGIVEDSGGLFAPGRIEQLRCPVTLIRGDRSPWVVPAIHQALMARVPQAREHVVTGASHMVPITHPRAVARIIRRA